MQKPTHKKTWPYAALFIGIVCIAWSAIFVRWTSIPGPASAFYRLLIPAIVPLLTPRAVMVLLVKPQFEVERGQVGKGGIVRDPELHQAACARVRAAVENEGFQTDIIESPILGAEGNREFLLYAIRRASQ